MENYNNFEEAFEKKPEEKYVKFWGIAVGKYYCRELTKFQRSKAMDFRWRTKESDFECLKRELEENAYRMAGGDYSAPSQTVGDFLNHTSGTHFTRVQPTYMGGGTALCDLHTLFDRGICRTLEAGIAVFGRRIPGFDAPDAVLTGPETRTSAPYRVKRRENLTSGQCDNLYPCGEGAGYAGGIMSAAMDGIRCALAVMARYAPQA